MSPPAIYFDYNATTPLDGATRDVLIRALDAGWANPSSIHGPGRLARSLLDDARDRLAASLGCRPSELVFTSGGTESNNLAILGAARSARERGRGRHLLCSPIEHPSVLACHRYLASREGFELTLLPVDDCGRVDPAGLERALRPDTILVSVLAANNETGVVQPIADLGQICRNRRVPFHTDAVQWFGKMPFAGFGTFPGDLVPLCAHKLHGPKGAGALFVRSPLFLSPGLLGGSQEAERRAGTENLPAILALVDVFTRFVAPPVFTRDRLAILSGRMAQALAVIDGVRVVAANAERLPNTVAFTVEGSDSLALLANLDLAGIAASSGSACSVGSLEPSHVLLAMGYPPALAAALVRFSLGRESSSAEVDAVLQALPEICRRCRSRG